MAIKNRNIETSRIIVPGTDREIFTVSETCYGPMEFTPHKIISKTSKTEIMKLEKKDSDSLFIPPGATDIEPETFKPELNEENKTMTLKNELDIEIFKERYSSAANIGELTIQITSLKSDCESSYLSLVNIITTKENSMNSYMRVILTVAIFNMILMVFLVAFSVS